MGKELNFGKNKNAFIKAIETGDIFYFDYIGESISESISANYSTYDVIGRSVPLRSYTSTGARTVNLDLLLLASVEAGDRGTPTKVLEYVSFLKALVYPRQEGYFIKPPPVVVLKLGNFLTIKSVVTSVNVNWKPPFSVKYIPLQAEVSLTFEQVRDDPFSYKDILDSLDVGVG